MQGASRDSLARLREELPARAEDDTLGEQSRDLLALSALLGREAALRTALVDPSSQPEARAGIATTLLQGQVGEPALHLLQEAARNRWSRSRDLADALERLGAVAGFRAAERQGTLDAVEDELFRFGRVLNADPQLRAVLEDPELDVERKVGVLHSLLEGKVQPVTSDLVEHVARSPRGRRITDAVDELVALAGERHQEVLAEVRVAAPLEPAQEQRLASALGRVYGRPVRLQVEVDPTVLGGGVVTVGDEVIDGSVTHKLEQARRRFTG